MVMEVGRVCVKLAGHEAGKRCVIVDVLDKVYVMVSGPGVKRRRCNIAHLESLEQKVEIAKGAPDEDVKRTLEAAGLVKIEKPSEKPSEPKEDTA
ncbi:MAG: 50S ribosomal protein L14e [Hadesarchaea archaeon DG-33]|nr:MAG: 50S ribosomal protein L14e [Hadesarchaea archaeon DG-33]